MARLVALEWDAREARIAVGRTRVKDLVIEDAFTVELLPRDPGQTFADVNVGQKVAAALAARGIHKPETLVAVGRANIELRLLQLPPAPPDELPDLVRFQAMRQFATIGEDWSLDFVELKDGDAGNVSVLAAAISPELVEQIRDTCRAGDLQPKHLVLRPFAAASLLRRAFKTGDQRCRLVVDVLADEADLSVLVENRVAFLRTVRLAADSDDQAQARVLLGEIRRTIGAAQNQLRDQRVEAITLCGEGADYAAIQDAIEQSLKLPVETFDPFAQVALGRELRDRKPANSGRYAPLLGLLTDAADGQRHDIDFLNPRRRPVPEGRGRRTALLGAAAACLLLLLAFLLVQRLWSLDAEIAELKQQSRGLDKSVTWANERLTHAQLIEEFTQGDVSWLDELHRLSDRVLPPDEARVTKLNFSARPTGGRLTLEGYVAQSAYISALEERLRDKSHRVVGKGGAFDDLRPQFPWRFNETVTIEPGQEDAAGTEEEAEQTVEAVDAEPSEPSGDAP
ncbi:MAG: hypothetical protein J5I93_24610 [Pirellulaceae bacterium]|nr:hypothetical protein [Pirellulaceae bacterium]